MLSVKAQKIQVMLLADLHRSLFNAVYIKDDSPVYVNYEVNFGSETHSSINIDYNKFESFTFTFVNVRDSKDTYRVDVNSTSNYIFTEQDYQSVLSLIIQSYTSK